MPNDIYGYNAQYRGVGIVTAKNMILTVSGTTGGTSGEYLVQNVQIQYQRPTRILRELSSANGYYLGSPPQGILSIARIIGSKPITALLGPSGTGIWSVPSSTDSSTDGRTAVLTHVNNNAAKYVLHGCIVQNISIRVDINSSLVQEDCIIQFGMME